MTAMLAMALETCMISRGMKYVLAQVRWRETTVKDGTAGMISSICFAGVPSWYSPEHDTHGNGEWPAAI
jgi:hypothetical protein